MSTQFATEPQAVCLVAGGAGFIAATLIHHLLEEGKCVLAVDNLSRGNRAYLDVFGDHPKLAFVKADLSVRQDCEQAFEAARAMGRVTEVWHLAANSDIPAGVADPDIDHRDTFLTTFEILRGMRAHGVGELFFASSSAVYGDLGDQPLHENIGPLLPISNYGAMKLASEAQISAAVESFLQRALLFRFPNVVGVPATHGVLLDFVRKLLATPDELQVLGDGTQQKSYLHVSDLVRAMLHARAHLSVGKRSATPLNIGPLDDGVTVRWIAEQVVANAAPGARIRFGTGNKGWTGDVPRFTYSTQRLQALGWVPALDSAAAVQRAIREIVQQEGVRP